MKHKYFALFAAFIMLCLTVLPSMAAQEKTIPYDPDFLQLLSQGWIRKAEIVEVSSGETYLRTKLATADGKKQEVIRVNVVVDDELLGLLQASNVQYEFTQESAFGLMDFLRILSAILTWVLWIAVVVIFARLARGVEQIARNIKKD